MQFSLLYGQQLDIELGSADRTVLFTTARRKQAINDAMHNWERIVECTPVYGNISIVNGGDSVNMPSFTGAASAGSGYSVNDILTLVGGTFTTAAQYKVLTVGASGNILTVSLQAAGSYTVLPANPVSTTGGTGTGATLNGMWVGTSEYDLLTNFSTFIRMKDTGETPSIKDAASNGSAIYYEGEDLPQTAPPAMNVQREGWRGIPSSVPNGWYIREDAGSTFIGLTPPPLIQAGHTWTLIVPYLSYSTDMVADSDLPFTVLGKSFARLVPYHQGLVHYAAGLLEPLRKNYPEAERQMKLYAGYVAQFVAAGQRNQPQEVRYARDYFREAGRPVRAVDPHRFPAGPQ